MCGIEAPSGGGVDPSEGDGRCWDFSCGGGIFVSAMVVGFLFQWGGGIFFSVEGWNFFFSVEGWNVEGGIFFFRDSGVKFFFQRWWWDFCFSGVVRFFLLID